jgi:DNA modification methylase
VPSVEIWQECLRVLKPGGHLLAFAGSRTYHRMAVRIEDAGFDIRDQIMWIYGSGFPKSHNISKQLDKRGGNNNLTKEVADALKEARVSRGISKTEADKLFCDGTTNYQWFEGRKDGVRLPDDETFQKICNEWNELDKYKTIINSANREVVGKYEGDAGGLGGERLGSKGGDITIPATNVAKDWNGWGTALKPAHEPIVMARKPIEGTVAENTLQYGVGGLNIDGTRVSVEDMDDYAFNMAGNERVKAKEEGELTGMYEGGWKVDKTPKELPQGRWPANVILECTCENPKVVSDKYDIRTYNDYKNTFKSYEENDKDKGEYEIKDVETTKVIHTDPSCPCYILDKQSGNRKGMASQNCNNQALYGGNALNQSTTTRDGFKVGFNDEGGASRFFYCPKASKKDRDEGNIHPTVKPTELMKYLIRLVTPKDGIVLDPFMGSGSTGKAAMQEGMWFVGIEREKEYYEIAKQRIEYEADKRKFW